jgi:hypothetical protein
MATALEAEEQAARFGPLAWRNAQARTSCPLASGYRVA